MATFEQVMADWLFEHCVNVTTATGSYSEDAVSGTTTAEYSVEISSGDEEDLDAVVTAMLPACANHEDLDPDSNYILLLGQIGFGEVEYHFSGTSTVSGTDLDYIHKVS